MKKTKRTSSRVSSLEGLKAIAIIAIILYHVLPDRVPGGFLGVDIFLILSGYFTASALSKQTTVTEHVAYLKKQISKLWPALVGMCTTVLLYTVTIQQQALASVQKTFLPSITFINNIWQIFAGTSYFDTGYSQSPYTHLWYLALNVQLYFIIICIVMLFRKKQSAFLGTILVSICLMGITYILLHDINRVYYGLDTRAFSFFIGALLSTVYPRQLLSSPIKRESQMIMFIASSVSFVAMLIMMISMDATNPFLYMGGFLLFDLFVGVFIISGIHSNSIFNVVLSTPVLATIGTHSYHYYLWYYPSHYFYTNAIGHVGENVWIHVLAQFGLTILLGELSYYIFHKTSFIDYLKPKRYAKHPLSQRQSIIKWVSLSTIALLSIIGLFFITPIEDTSAQELQNLIAENAQALETSSTTALSSEQSNDSQPSSESTSDQESTSDDPAMLYAKTVPITFVGDSVLLTMAQPLGETFQNAVIDGKVSRQFNQGLGILQALQSNGRLNNTVVIMLGTNGTILERDLTQMIDYLGSQRKIFFVNVNVPRTWQNGNNDVLNQVQATYSNVHIIDWYNASRGHTELFYTDLIHPSAQGSLVLTELIKEAVYQYK